MMKRISVFVLFYCVCAGMAFAQMSSQSGQSSTLEQQLQQQQQSTQPLRIPTQSESMFTTSANFFRNLQAQGFLVQPPPYDRTVDSNTYVLGPGDILNVGIWGATPLSYNLSVTPEGSVIVPGFGVLNLSGMTLAKAKAYTRKELSTQYKNSSITLTLIYPRSFYVMVSGVVRRPGRYVVNSFDRVDRAFTLANLPLNNMDTTHVYPDFSLRRIELIHRNGKTQNVDLLKFYMTGNLSDDPCLQAGDAIVVPKENLRAGSISISGAVKMPGNYEYVPGDNIKSLLQICAGLTGLADSGSARVLTWNGHSYDEKTVDLRDSTVLNEPLPPNSRVVVPTDRSKINDYFVWVTGEVNAPGIYPISRDSTKLSTVIGLAGGFTKWASLTNSVIYRLRPLKGYPRSILYDTLAYIYKAAGISTQQVEYLKEELLMRLKHEQVSANFVKLFADKDEKYDYTLRSGDSIYVARNRYSVYVFGQVNEPGYVNYHEGWKYSDYVKAAGGFTDAAEPGKGTIIKGGTLQWYKKGSITIAAGDLVFVPKVTLKPELYGWNMFKDIVTVVGGVASVISVVILAIKSIP